MLVGLPDMRASTLRLSDEVLSRLATLGTSLRSEPIFPFSAIRVMQ